MHAHDLRRERSHGNPHPTARIHIHTGRRSSCVAAGGASAAAGDAGDTEIALAKADGCASRRGRGQALLRLVRRQKLGIDPALHAGVLDLDPVPLPACSCELRAPRGSPQNGRVSGGCRPDVYAGPLQKNDIPVLRRRRMARLGISCRRSRGNLGRASYSARRGKIRPSEGSWC